MSYITDKSMLLPFETRDPQRGLGRKSIGQISDFLTLYKLGPGWAKCFSTIFN